MSETFIKLGDHSFITKLAGFEHSKYFQYNATHEINEIPLIQGKNIRNGKVVNSYDWYISKEISDLLPRSVLNKRCIVLPYVGSKLGELAIFENEFTCHLASNVAKIEMTSDIVELEYLYYYLIGPYGQSQLFKDKQGSAQPNITMLAIRETKVKIFDKTTQQQIAKVLSDLDAKIELNNKINAELEAMAKLIYDYWFVQFEFPNEEGKPYKSSGGKMVWNEELKREVPESWEVMELGKYAKIKKGTLITGKTSNSDGKIKVVSAGLDFSYYHDIANYPENTITISASGASAGYINFWREPIFACDCTTVRGESDADTIHILGFLKMRQDFIYQQARGSAQPHVYPKDIEVLLLPTPPIHLLEKFGKEVLSGNSKISNNIKENQKLAELRDWLLPMLMNGQVRIDKLSDKEEPINMAAEEREKYR